VFHRHQLLFLIQEVIKHCPDLPQGERERIRADQLGQIFLMANDQLFPRLSRRTPRMTSRFD